MPGSAWSTTPSSNAAASPASSESVLDAIARALQLDDAEREHLIDLARAASTLPTKPRRRGTRSAAVRPGMQLVLDAITGGPALIRNGRMDILAANMLGRAFYTETLESPGDANIARYTFLDPRAQDFYPNWDTAADIVVAILRTEAGRDPYDRAICRTWSVSCPRQRPVPHPVGRAQRPPARRRHQELHPPDRRRADLRLRGHAVHQRTRTHLPHLRHRTRIAQRGTRPPPRQLASHQGRGQHAANPPPATDRRSTMNNPPAPGWKDRRMHTRTLGQGLQVSAIGLGCMGMSQSYGPNPGDRDDDDRACCAARSSAASPSSTPPRSTAPTSTRSSSARRSQPLRDQVVIATKFGWRIEDGKPRRARQPARADPPRRRRLPAAAAHRLHRPVLPAPRRPGRADRGRRRRRRRAGRGRQGPPLRAVRGRRRARSAAPTPSTPSPPCRASTRCGPATRRPRCCPRCAELGIGFVPFSPLGKGFLTGTVDAVHQVRRRRRPRARIPRFTAENRAANQALVDHVADLAERQGRDPGPGRAGLAARPAAVDRARSPAPAASSGSRRTPPPPRCRCPPTRSPTSTQLAARVGVQGDRYNEQHMSLVGR